MVTIVEAGKQYRIEGDEDQNVYTAIGFDKHGRVWLSLDEPEYDGYDGDLIIIADSDGSWAVNLADDRSRWNSSFIRLIPV